MEKNSELNLTTNLERTLKKYYTGTPTTTKDVAKNATIWCKNHIQTRDRHENLRLFIEDTANTRWENKTRPKYTHKQADLPEATEDDEELKMLKQMIINGWQEDAKIHKPIKSYWSLKERLSVQDGLVTKGECIVIPKSRQNSPEENPWGTPRHRKMPVKGKKYHILERNEQRYWKHCKIISYNICKEYQIKNTKETMIIKEHATRTLQPIF